ncbi:MAG: ribosome biogenesis GTP-binding protein YihA/YsxC [Gammaproteobacteria bacterium]|nr:ribosome biogenesis GTP-binding protein YihA/YsxC [Gammaproteobacteria bacterium]MDH5630183.1 ribosome biogenesis GTP-binding protein YihA/YsxC [Gammaproteobacteria bacterium]
MTNSTNNPFQSARYLMGAAKIVQLPEDQGVEVALAGRSNAGKSTALNTITQQKSLAKTSKTPGRTQLINLFWLDDDSRLVDLPGYGFAKVAKNVKDQWQKTLSEYLQERKCLQGLIIFMDIRHPLKETDKQMLSWATAAQLPTHVVLSKADKLKSGARKSALLNVKNQLNRISSEISCQFFSATSKIGLDELVNKLKLWYGWLDENTILNELKDK